jgi:hypothetical protein
VRTISVPFRGTGLQFGHDEVISFSTVGVTRAGDRKSIVAKPVDQQSDILGSCYSFIAGGTSSAEALC